MSDKEIERLDFILDRLIKFGGNVESNTLRQYKLYEEYNDNEEKINSNFKKLQSEFYKVGASEFIIGQDDYLICACDKTTDFKKEYGGFKNYYLKLEETNKETDIKNKKKETIEKRKNANISFDYLIKRPYYIFLFFIAILTPFGINKCSAREEYKIDTEHMEKNKPQLENKSENRNKLEKQESSLIQIDTTELRND